MKKHISKSRSALVTQPRSFRRFVNQLFGQMIKCQPQTGIEGSTDELIQLLKNMEQKIDAYLRALKRRAR